MNGRLVAATLSIALAAGCGARSSPFDASGDEGSDDAGPDDRPGSCGAPIELPFQVQTIRGRLLGGGRIDGICDGLAEDDRGREDVYTLTPPYSTDVILTLREETDFPAVIRVSEGPCDPEAAPTELCAAPAADDPYTFWVEGGREYTIAIDAPQGTDGRYAFDLAFGWPPLEACPIHGTTIAGVVDNVFQWANTFGPGYGRVDGACGGPGRENMFRVDVQEPVYLSAYIEHRGGPASLSLRTSCGAVSELRCEGAEAREGQLFLDELLFPGEYFLVIDQESTSGGGSYDLTVVFYAF